MSRALLFIYFLIAPAIMCVAGTGGYVVRGKVIDARKNYDRAVLTNGWWEYVRYHELHDGIDFNHNYLQMVDALTTSDIRDFCRLLATSGNRIQVTMK